MQKQYNSYIVYSDGRIFSLLRNKFLKQHKDEKGYFRVKLSINNVSKNYKVHRIIAECFIDKIEGKTQVNHKNGVKTDNKVENLEWCNNSENQKHSWANGFIKSGHAKMVLDTLTGIYYESATELANLIGVNRITLMGKLNGNRNNKTQYQYV